MWLLVWALVWTLPPVVFVLVRHESFDGDASLALLVACVSLALLGGALPLAMTRPAQLLFPAAANGSLLAGPDGRAAGSALVGQPFDEPRYFWGRLSATSAFPYDGAASAGSNFGPSSPDLLAAVGARVNALRAADPENLALVPVDLVTASGSGLDPHISPAAAYYQVSRVARARGVAPEVVRALVAERVEGRWLGLLGEPRVNVLELNLALDRLGR